MKTLACCLVITLLSIGCNSEPKTLRDKAAVAQENLAEARERAADLISDSEESAVDIVADARQDAKDTVRNANEEAASLVRDAKQDLNAAMSRLGESEVKVQVETTVPVDIRADNKQ